MNTYSIDLHQSVTSNSEFCEQILKQRQNLKIKNANNFPWIFVKFETPLSDSTFLVHFIRFTDTHLETRQFFVSGNMVLHSSNSFIELKNIYLFAVYYDFQQNAGNRVWLHYQSEGHTFGQDLVMHVSNLPCLLLGYPGQLNVVFPPVPDNLRFFLVKFETVEEDEQMFQLN